MDKKKTLIIGLTGNLVSDQRMQRIAGALQEDIWDVEVYFRDYYKYPAGAQKTQNDYPYKTKAIHSIFNHGVAFYVWYNVLLFLKLIFKRADRYYAVDSDTLPAFICLSLLRMKPLIYDAHEYFSEVPELRSSLKKNVWHFVTRLGVQRARHCITVGASLARELERVYGKQFHCIRNVPVYRKNNIIPFSEPPIILYQGALNQGRMLEMLIAAMPSLPEFKCILAGEGDLSAELREQAEGINRIEFVGLLDSEQLKELTAKCFAGYNLLDDSISLSYHFSLSNKYFDYMHAGIPSISSKLPEYTELNNKWACGVCIDNNQKELIQTLNDWKNNPHLYQKLKENAMFAATAHNWNEEKQLLTYILRS